MAYGKKKGVLVGTHCQYTLEQLAAPKSTFKPCRGCPTPSACARAKACKGKKK